LLDADGVLDLSHNWFKPGWVATVGTLTGQINDDGTGVSGAAPGFRNEAGQDYRLAPSSACIDRAGPLSAAVLPDNDLASEYVRHQAGQLRQVYGTARDLGACEFLAPDLDNDGDVDKDDLIIFIACASGAGIPHVINATCTQADLDADGDVDMDDFGSFQRAYTAAQ
jgi:hypothetical protein